jgi:diguanylate cyclase (GGDEF)-like protein
VPEAAVEAAAEAASPAELLRSAQRLRANRVLWGAAAYAVTGLIAVGCLFAGLLEPVRILHFAIAVVVITATFLAVIATGVNLKLRDPSMTGAQVVVSLWPSVYVMYHVAAPQARMPFLLMAMVAMLFGVMALDFRRLLLVGAVVLGSYLAMLGVLVARAPERVDLRVEGVVVFAYAAVLLQVSFLGSYIAGLRQSLKERNRALRAAMAELQELATRDPLTRLPNRRAVMMQLEREQARIQRRRPDQATPCVCLLDIDFFKQINDSHGHQAGDAVLRAVGSALASTLRKGDFAGRFGGEEFLILFPESSPVGALRAAERVRQAIARLEIPELAAGQRVQVSIGVAAHHEAETIENTLGRADRALYLAKESGRSQVVFDGTPGEGTVMEPTEVPGSLPPGVSR